MCSKSYTRSVFLFLVLSLLNLPLFAAFSVDEEWSTYVGGVYGNDIVKAVAMDSAGRLYVGGYLGDFSISNDDGVAVTDEPFSTPLVGFVAQVSPLGVLQWYNVLGDNENDEVRGVAERGASVFAAARVSRTATNDNGTDACLYSLSKTDGSFNWNNPVVIGAAHTTNAFNAVTVDTNGNIYAVGYTSIAGLTPTVAGYQAGGTTYGNSLKGNLDACVVKISPAGAILWVHYLGGANEDRALACTIGTNGFLYVGGETRSSGWVTVPGEVTPSASNKAGFVVKLSTAGTHIWSTFLGGSQSDSVAGLAFEKISGRLFAAGTTTSAGFMSAHPRLNTYGGNGDGFVSSITDSGLTFTVNWSKFYGSNQTDTVSSIQQLDDSQMVLGGSTSGGGWLPEADNTFHGGADGFVTVMADNGDSFWSRYTGSSGNDYTYAVAAAEGFLYAGGLTLSDDSWVSGGFHCVWDKDSLFGANEFGFLVKYVSSGYIPELPAFITQPQSISVEEQQSARFTVEAVSVEEIIYQWYVNDAPVTGATNTAFTINAVTLAQDGDAVSCVISNIAGSVTSDIAILTVTAIPKGWITMELAPAAAVSDGVAWSIDGGATWRASGAMVHVLTGVYSIVYKNVFGWAAPSAPTATTVLNLQTNSLNATFTEIIYTNARRITGTNVVVTVNPPAGTEEWTLRETVPVGLTPYGYPASANWNSGTRLLRYTEYDSSPVQFSYSVKGEEGVYQLSGLVNYNPAGNMTTVGDTQVTIAVEPPPVIPDPDIIGFAPDSGVAGSWLLTFISVLDQSYLIVTNGSPVAGVWAPQSQVNGAAGQTTTSVAAPGDALFYRVRTP